MKARIQMWGNSLAIRIPKPFANEINVSNNSEVEISIVNGAILVEPFSKDVDLDSLLDRVTKKNIHKLIDFGSPVGREIW